MKSWIRVTPCALAIGITLWLALPSAESRTPQNALRFPYLKMEQLNEPQRQLAAAVMKNSTDARFLTGPFNL